MRARTILLLAGVWLAATVAADPIVAPRHGPDGWFFGPAEQGQENGHDPRRTTPPTARKAATVPLPRPRPDVPDTTGAIEPRAFAPATPVPPTAPMPTPSAVPGPQSASAPRPASAPLSATGQGVAGDTHGQAAAAEMPTRAVEPVEDNGGAAMPPVSVSDAGGGRLRIEAHDASLGQVLAALQDSHLIQFSASDAPSGTVSGTYTGTLPQVLARILGGHDYFLRVTASGTELHPVNASGDTKAAVRNAVSSNVDAAAAPTPAPAPVPAFSLLPPSPVPREQARVTPSPAAKARARAHSSAKTP